MGAPILTIEEMKFELQEGFSDGYTNNIKPAGDQGKVTHPYRHEWWGGAFKPLRIELNLGVGAQDIITTPEHLKDICGKFYKMALADQPAGSKPKKITFSVGSWYKRRGYVRDLDINYKAPWTSEGLPMTATIRFELIIDFDAEDDYAKKLPSSKTFTFT